MADLESQVDRLIKELERRERPQPERHHGDEVSFLKVPGAYGPMRVPEVSGQARASDFLHAHS